MEEDENPALTFDFKSHRVNLIGYLLRTSNLPANGGNPISWDFLVGDTLETMRVVHSVRDNYNLDSPYFFMYFSIANPINRYFRYVQFKMIGPNSIGTNMLTLDAIEFYGDLLTSMGEERCMK